MRAFIRDNAILIENFDLNSERPIFDALVKELKSNKGVKIKREIMGPSEDVVVAEYKGDEILLCYDIDYELCPIRCGKKNIEYVLETTQKILNEIS